MFRSDFIRNDIDPENDDLVFQILDWYATDIDVGDDGDEDDNGDDKESKSDLKYFIKAFGVDASGKSIGLTITDFQPFFYIQISNTDLGNAKMFNMIKTFLLNKYGKKYDIVRITRTSKINLYGFTNHTKEYYMKITFKNLKGFKSATYNLKEIVIMNHKRKIKQFESNIEPFIRFTHLNNISPCGWVKVQKGDYDFNEELLVSDTSNDLITHWQCVENYKCDSMAPFIVASYDIECTSSHGDFPMAIKSYKKTARELYDYYKQLVSKRFVRTEIVPLLLKQIYGLFEIDGVTESVLTYVIPKKNQVIDKDVIKEQALNRIEDIYTIMKDKPDTEKKTIDFMQKDLKLNDAKELVKKLKETREQLVRFKKADYEIEDIIMNMVYDKYKDFEKELKMSYINRAMNNSPRIMSLFDDDTVFDKVAKQFEKMGCPKLEGDEIIQIGTTFHIYGQKECFFKHIITLKDCDDNFDVDEIVECNSEKQLLNEWRKMIKEMDPDIVTGYNIFGFDNGYMRDRSLELRCVQGFEKLGRFKDIEYDDKKNKAFIVKELQSSALGQNILKYFSMEGRVQIDIMKLVQKDHKLDTYKLDFVASHFINGKVKSVIDNKTIIIDKIQGIYVNNFIKLNDNKYRIQDICSETNTVTIENDDSVDISGSKSWGMVKDDISPNEIFKAQNGDAVDRAKIAKYCIQDCALCNYLMMKLEIIANNAGMANVCLVPLSYIFLRGQGIKIFSLVAKQCLDDGFIIPVVRKPDDSDESYEGAIVLDPEPGIYEEPVSVLDFASLYPSSMISENISHDSIVLDKKYDNLPDVEYLDITYDVNGRDKVVRFAQFKNGEKGVMPRILMKLLSQRKLTRKKMLYESVVSGDQEFSGLVSNETDDKVTLKNLETNEVVTFDKDSIKKRQTTYSEFEQAVLEGQQLAFKITANSLYGQVGARTSPIYLQELAASTTATGRNLVMKLKNFAEENYDCKVVYGDTDSIFIKFTTLTDEKGDELKGKERLQASIDKSIELSKAFKPHLKAPHDAEYEKTFFPFIIMSKKRYVGNLYEEDVNKFKQKSMGIVLKRRDNANILKTVYGGMIDIILNENNVDKSIEFLKKQLKNIEDGKVDIKDLVITKTLKGSYADPSKIAHKVLADRMMDRDPGSAPQVNDRVPYVYIYNKEKNALQGDKIENPDFIQKNNVKIDYAFYITNQIQKPVSQLLSLRVEQIKGCKKNREYFENLKHKYLKEYNGDVIKTNDKVNTLKELEVSNLIFNPIITKINQKAKGQTTMTRWFPTS